MVRIYTSKADSGAFFSGFELAMLIYFGSAISIFDLNGRACLLTFSLWINAIGIVNKLEVEMYLRVEYI